MLNGAKQPVVSLAVALLSVNTLWAEELKTSCEWKPHNMAVWDPCPEFHWEVEEQTYCRVLVASTMAQLARNHGGLWDSGKVETVLPVLEYAGGPLNDGGTSFWKAQVWTKERPKGFWSEPQQFTLKIRSPLPARWGHVRLFQLTFRMKTNDLAGTAQVYPHEFDGANCGGSRSRCSAQGTTPWTNYALTFKTGDDGRGRISFRIFKGQGKAWFDDIALSEVAGENREVMARKFSNGLVLYALAGRAAI